MGVYEEAQRWVFEVGYSVIPLRYRDKRPAFDALKITGQEHGAGWAEYKTRLPTEAELKMWFTGPRRNLGVVTGYNGLVVLDFDTQDAYALWHDWAIDQGSDVAHQIVREGYQVKSARGVHVYVQVGEPVTSYQVGVIDVKAEYGYVAAPPSIHPSGHKYQGNDKVLFTVNCLDDVFPFKPTPCPRAVSAPVYDSPWESADHATEERTAPGAIDRIKADLSPADLIGVAASPRKQVVLCPVHNDTEPSCYLYPDGHWHCFGCGKGGDVINLYMELNKCSTKEAILALDTKHIL